MIGLVQGGMARDPTEAIDQRLDPPTLLSKTEIKNVERPLNSPNWPFWYLPSSSNTISPFRVKDIPA